MSGIFGILNRNNQIVEKKTANVMQDVMLNWEPDESNIYIDGPVALGHTMFWNTPESKYEHLPLQKDVFVLTMDARIDNRDELFNQLELPDRPFSEIGDSEFILGAYKRWGEECPKYLLGDFVFALWDEEKKQLFCARDHVGIKPFYYYIDEEKFIFANDIEPIVKIEGFNNEINDKAVINFLSFLQLKDPVMTFYKDVMKLEAATTLAVTSTSVKKETYWKIEDTPKTKFDSEEKYIEKLRNLITESVECRSRSIYPIASHLSGGLDSSAIAVIASRYLRKNNKDLYAYNWLHSPEENENEKDFDFAMSRQIAISEKINHQYIDFNAQELLEVYMNHDIRYNDTVFFWYEHFVRRKAKSDKVRTILSGWGGDELISNNGLGYLAELFWKGHVYKSCKELYKLSIKHRTYVSNLKFYYRFFRNCITHLFLPGLPFKLYCKLAAIDCKQFDYGQVLTQYYKNYRKSLNIDDEKKIKTVGQNITQIDLFNHGHLLTRIESWASSGQRDKIEYRYPLLDKRIIEFALAIPEEFFFMHGESRYIFRKSIKDILPNELCYRHNTKYEPNRLKRLENVTLQMLDLLMNTDTDFNMNDNKYIDKNKFYEIITSVKKGNSENLSQFLSIIKAVILLLKVK